jgi:7,8-dihydropterin-6-yl-methyl-4-(beta-D-ribofuranosyl)aminobenzene 5'-phosphate synthase
MFRLLVAIAAAVTLWAQPRPAVKSLRIQVLSTQLTDPAGLGEWGFAALVEVDGRRILFDTGAHPDTVLNNARALKVDLSNVNDVILSHHHLDHTAGLITLRKAMRAKQPDALSRVHAGKGIALRPEVRGEYEELGGRIVEHDKPVELHPGVWLTGPIPREHDEGDTRVPEDMAMVFNTSEGLVVLSGCGHAGIVNTMSYSRKVVREAPIHAALGGFHLFAYNDEKLNWTADQLRGFGIKNFLGAHCTGVEATYRIRERAGLTRRTCSVAAVGATFELGKDMAPGVIAR